MTGVKFSYASGSFALGAGRWVTACRYPIHTGTLEGVNNKVKVIERIAYGFRDLRYFFLKIRAHFSGIHPP